MTAFFAELAFDVKNRLLHMLFGNLIDNPHIVSVGRPHVVIDVITAKGYSFLPFSISQLE